MRRCSWCVNQGSWKPIRRDRVEWVLEDPFSLLTFNGCSSLMLPSPMITLLNAP